MDDYEYELALELHEVAAELHEELAAMNLHESCVEQLEYADN